jgi:chitinase
LKKSFYFLNVITIILLIFSNQSYSACTKRLLAYYPYWNSNYRSDKLQFSKMTHVIHAFAEPNTDGTLFLDPGPPPLLEPALITSAHANGVYVLISIGGSSTAGQPPDSTFRTISQSASLRTAFANNIVTFCTTYGYDGVDIDWEMPGAMDPTDPGATDRANFDLMIQAIRIAFNSALAPPLSPTWLISIATSCDNWGAQWLDYPTLNNYVDFYNDMTYDMHGSWNNTMGYNAPLFQGNYAEDNLCDQTAMDYMLTTRGVPAAQVNMGIPFYGYLFPGGNTLFYTCGNCDATEENYNAIAPLIGNGWTYYWDAASDVPYLIINSGDGIYSYDDPQSVGLKSDYALNTRNVGGIFMWDVSEDYMGPSNEPLLDAMYSKFSAFCTNASATFTPVFSPSATASTTLTVTVSATPTATGTYTKTPTGTITPTITKTPTPSLTLTHTTSPATTPTLTITQTYIPVPPNSTMTDTLTVSATCTVVSATQTISAALTATNIIVTITLTPTPVITSSPTAATTSALTIGPIKPYPNPINPIIWPLKIVVNITPNDIDRITLKIYTVAYRLIREEIFEGTEMKQIDGGVILTCDSSELIDLSNGTYYYLVIAEKDGAKVRSKADTIIILK